jgi:hypothetical protein
LNKNDKVLATSGKRLKLIGRDNGKIDISSLVDINRPVFDINEKVLIKLRSQDLLLAIRDVNFVKIFGTCHHSDGILRHAEIILTEFAGQVENIRKDKNKYIMIEVPVKSLRIFLQNVIRSLREKLRASGEQTRDVPREMEIDGMDIAQLFDTDDGGVSDRNGTGVKEGRSFDQAEFAILNVFLRMEEALYAKSLHPQATEAYQGLWKAETSRSFSGFGRLGSFIGFPKYGNVDLLELCEQGAFSKSELESEIRHVSDPNTPISPFIDERIFSSNGWLQLIRELPHLNALQCYPSQNLPIHATVNNMNSLLFDVKISQICRSADDKICVLFEDDSIRIYDTKVALNLLVNSNIRKFHNKKWNPPNLFNYKKGMGTGIEYHIQNAITENDEKTEDPKAATVAIEPKVAFLDQLYLMGFPVNLAKKALIQVKNSSLDAAIEKLLILQEEEQKNALKVPTKENATMLKPEWGCSLCTYLNLTAPGIEPKCEVCENLPGLDAYYTVDELQVMQEEELHQMELAKSAEDIKTREDLAARANHLTEDQSTTDTLHASTIDLLKFSELQSSHPQSWLNRFFVFGGFHNPNSQKSILRIKRYAYNPSYLKTLFRCNDDSKKSMSFLGNHVLTTNEELSNLSSL